MAGREMNKLPSGTLLSHIDYQGRSVLHHVARSGNVEVLNYLLEHKPLLNTKDMFGRSVLDYASMSGSLEMIKRVLELYQCGQIAIGSSSQWSVL